MPDFTYYQGKWQEMQQLPEFQNLPGDARSKLQQRFFSRLVLQDPEIRAGMEQDPNLASTLHKQWYGPSPAPDLMSEERLGPAVDYLRMLDPTQIPASAKQMVRGAKGVITGSAMPGEQFPRAARATEMIQGAYGTVAPPAIAAGLATAALPTAAGLAVFSGLHAGMTKLGKVLPEMGVEVQPELWGLGTELSTLYGGTKIGGAIHARMRGRPGQPPPPEEPSMPEEPPPPGGPSGPGSPDYPPRLSSFPEVTKATVIPRKGARRPLPGFDPLQTSTTALEDVPTFVPGKPGPPDIFTAFPGVTRLESKLPKKEVPVQKGVSAAKAPAPVVTEPSALPAQMAETIRKATEERQRIEVAEKQTQVKLQEIQAAKAAKEQEAAEIERRMADYGPKRGQPERRKLPPGAMPGAAGERAFRQGQMQGLKQARETGLAQKIIETTPPRFRAQVEKFLGVSALPTARKVAPIEEAAPISETPITEEAARRWLGVPENPTVAAKVKAAKVPAAEKPLKGTEVLRLEAAPEELAQPDIADLKARVQAKAETLANAATQNKALGEQQRINTLNRIKIRREQIFKLIDEGNFQQAMEAYRPSLKELQARTAEERATARAEKARLRTAKNRITAPPSELTSEEKVAIVESPEMQVLQRKSTLMPAEEAKITSELPETPVDLAGLEKHKAELAGIDKMAGTKFAANWDAVENMADMRGFTNKLPLMEKYRAELDKHGDAALAKESLTTELKEQPPAAKVPEEAQPAEGIAERFLSKLKSEEGFVSFGGRLPKTELTRTMESQLRDMDRSRGGREHTDNWEKIQRAALNAGRSTQKNLETLLTHYIRGAADPKIGLNRATEGLLKVIEKQKGEAGFARTEALNPLTYLGLYTKYLGEPLHNQIAKTVTPFFNKLGLISNFAQPEEWISAKRKFRARAGEIGETAKAAGKKLSEGLTQDQQKLLNKFLRGDLSEMELRKVRQDPRWQETVDATKEVAAFRDSLHYQAFLQNMITSETYAKNLNKYVPDFYRQYTDYLNAKQRGADFRSLKSLRMNLDRYRKSGNIPQEIKLDMGWIEEPAYPIAKGLAQAGRSLELNKLFRFASNNKDWTRTSIKDIPKAEVTDWIQLPKTPALGDLSGKFVRNWMMDDLELTHKLKSTASQMGDAYISEWKYSKVVMNPATHARNMFSNTVLNYLGGLSPFRMDVYGDAVKALRDKESNIYYKEAKEAGLLGPGTFAQIELNVFIDSWNRSKGSLTERLSLMAKDFREATLPEKTRKVSRATTGSAVGHALEGTRFDPAKLYQLEEQWFKMAKFIHNRQKGMSVDTAVSDALKWQFDYSEVPKTVEFLRRSPVGAPFITFTYKALPAILESAIKYPWRLGIILGLLQAVENHSLQKLGIQEKEAEKISSALPDRMRGSIAATSPKYMLLPVRDERNRLLYLDLTYILPWGDVAETGATGMPQQFLGNPILRLPIEFMINKSLYFGTDIVRPEDKYSSARATATRLKYAGRQMIPSLFPGGYGFQAISEAAQGKKDYLGYQRSLPQALAGSTLGLKIRPIDPNQERLRRFGGIEGKIDELERRQNSILLDQRLTQEERQAENQRVQEILNGLYKQYGEF